MNRRDLLKALPSVAAVPFVIKGTTAKAFEIEPKKHYIVLVDEAAGVDPRQVCDAISAIGVGGGAVFVVNHLHDGTDIEKLLRIYEVTP